MNYAYFKTTVDKIVTKDGRYDAMAYELIGDAVNYTAKRLKKDKADIKSRHISCQDLLKGIGEYAIQQYGPMAGDIFASWGLNSSMAIGNVVFNMIDKELLRASEKDSLEQFSYGPTFHEIFRKPFLPTKKIVPPVIDL